MILCLNYSKVMKIIIIGPPDCGKSSIFAKLCFDVSKPV